MQEAETGTLLKTKDRPLTLAEGGAARRSDNEKARRILGGNNDGKAEHSTESRSREDSSPRLVVQPPWPSAALGGGRRPLVACGLV